MLHVHILMVLFKGEYSLVMCYKCLNEKIKVLLALEFSQKNLISYYCNYGLP